VKVLIACESSGISREAWRKLGHDAWSCDLLPADDESPYHFQCDVMEVINKGWDLMIAHPSCTYLTNSAAWAYGDGPYHQKVKPETLVGAARRQAREEALNFVRMLMAAPISKIAIENPVGAIGTRIKPASQYIHPYEYGEDASKRTGLWLKGLPKLVRTAYCKPRIVEWPPGLGMRVERWGNQTDSGQNKLTPGADRWKARSKTYQGWADAMAEQWGDQEKGAN
jgi:hypothetical protein